MYTGTNYITGSLLKQIPCTLTPNYMKQSPPWKANIAQLVKKFPAFMEPERSLQYPQKPATGLYTEPHESSPQLTRWLYKRL